MKFFKKLRIGYQLILFAVLTVVVITLIFSAFYTENANIIVDKNTKYNTEAISQIQQNVNSNCEAINRLITGMSYTILIQDSMLETDRLKKFNLDQQIVDLLNKIQKFAASNGIIDIVILGENGNSYTLNGNLDIVNKMRDEFKGKNSSYFTGVKELSYSNRLYKCFLVGMEVVSVDKNYGGIGEKIGCFCVIINADSISPEIGLKSGIDNKFYLIDRENEVFSSNDDKVVGKSFSIFDDLKDYKSGTYTKVINGKRCLVQIDNLAGLGGKIVNIVPESELFKELAAVQRQTFLRFFIAILILSIPFAIIINNILRPLSKFKSFINKVKSGDLRGLNERIQLDGYMEMSIMSQEFNSMLDEIDNLTHRLIDTSSMLYQSELEKKQSELAFLQSQINPHFLYNTLESIKGIAAVRGVDEIKEMTKALSQIFRYSVNGIKDVHLIEEVRIVKSYIQIQQIRFVNRFEVIYNFTEEALECNMPKMILQPVVENAIYHGLEPMLEKGILYISAKTDKENLLISIADNGVGIEKTTLQKLKNEMDQKAGKTGIGIVNVHNRLKIKYGEGYGISIDSNPRKGTEINIKIPLGGQ